GDRREARLKTKPVPEREDQLLSFFIGLGSSKPGQMLFRHRVKLHNTRQPSAAAVPVVCWLSEIDHTRAPSVDYSTSLPSDPGELADRRRRKERHHPHSFKSSVVNEVIRHRLIGPPMSLSTCRTPLMTRFSPMDCSQFVPIGHPDHHLVTDDQPPYG